MSLILAVPIIMALLTGCGAMPGSASSAGQPSPAGDRSATEQPSPSPSSAARVVAGCPLTIPSRPGFVPPSPYPPEAPELYQSVWHGTNALWTMIDPEGEIWEDLPEENGRFTQKIFWWSEGYPSGEEPGPPLAVSGRRLDRSGSFATAGPAGGGFRDDIGKFMLVGIEIPAGCWELTAMYRDARLSYVVLVKG